MNGHEMQITPRRRAGDRVCTLKSSRDRVSIVRHLLGPDRYASAMEVRTFRAATVLATLLGVLVFGGVAHAGNPKADLENAEQLYANLNYEEANKLAAGVSKQHGLTHDQLVRAFRLVALSHAVLDREDPSRDAFIQLLTYDPEYQADPNLGPRVTTPFFEARGFWRGQPIKPGVEATATVKAKEAGTLKITVRDPTHIVKKASAGYRWGGTGEFTLKPVQPGEAVLLDIPEPPGNATRFDYYVQALDDKENVVLEAGTALSPKTVIVEKPAAAAGPGVAGGGKEKTKSVTSSAAFWGILGGVLVAGGVAAVVIATRPKDEATNVSLSPVLNCGAMKCN